MVLLNLIITYQSPYKGFNSVKKNVNAEKIVYQSPYKGFNSNDNELVKLVAKYQSPYKGFNRDCFHKTVSINNRVSIPL